MCLQYTNLFIDAVYVGGLERFHCCSSSHSTSAVYKTSVIAQNKSGEVPNLLMSNTLYIYRINVLTVLEMRRYQEDKLRLM